MRLAVYGVLGREVAVLVDGVREAGRREATSDGTALPSGPYVCRLVAGPHVTTRKVLLPR